MVSECVLISFFYMELNSFPSTTYGRGYLFSIVYFCLLCCKLTISAWVYFWTFYPVPLIYMSVFVPVHTVLITVDVQYRLKSGSLITPALFFLRIVWAIQSFVFPHKFKKF